MTELALDKPHLLPPKGLLIAMAAQLPLLISSVPLRPSALDVVAGTLLLIVGIVLNVWSERLFRRENVGVCPFTHVPALIVRGPYRLTRNPMYVGLVCLNLSVTLLSGVVANAWSSIAFGIWLHYAFVLPEEAFLRHELGSAFDAYATRVPRWLSTKVG
jgi:protein-S-isoprenylcysteine O-methyltransferase Ste14